MTDQQKTDHISDARQMVDHAELGRLADDLRKFEHHQVGSLRLHMDEVRKVIAACDGHSALLSENAALEKRASEAEAALSDYRVTADMLVSSLKSDLSEARDANSRWALRYADIREAAGIGHKPMLSEVPDAIRALRAERDEAVDVLREVANAPQPKGGGARFQRALASVNAFVARLNASAIQSIARETGK